MSSTVNDHHKHSVSRFLSLLLPTTRKKMVTSELISLLSKKKQSQVETTLMKINSRVTFSFLMVALALFLHMEISRPVACSPFKVRLEKDYLTYFYVK